jgi:hypothetical protein
MFCSDYGVKLMRIDSEIIIDVMNDLINKNIPFLPIHDSVVCNRINSFSVEKIMEKCFSKKYPSTKCSVKIKERKSESDNKPINICCSR